MPKIGLSKEECINQLQSYSNKIDEICGLFDDRGFILKGQKEKAQMLLTKLKEEFKDDYKLRHTERGKEQMTEVEQACFLPAIDEAHTRIYVKTNSIPSSKWLDDLYDVQGSSIKYYLDQLSEWK